MKSVQVELVDFDPNQERQCHYNGEAGEEDDLLGMGWCQTSGVLYAVLNSEAYNHYMTTKLLLLLF